MKYSMSASVLAPLVLVISPIIMAEGNGSEHNYKNVYNYEVMANLDFEPDRGQGIKDILESKKSYPQGFYIDKKNNRIFVLRYTMEKPSIPLIDIYDGEKFIYENTFILKGTEGRISEGLYVDNEKGKDKIYVRGKDSLIEFSMYAKQDEIYLTGNPVVRGNFAQSFSFSEGKIFIENINPQKNSDQSRGNYLIYDRGFSNIGNVSFDPEYSGTTKSKEDKMPKHQGFSAYAQGFVMSMGGYWKSGNPVTPYTYQGFNFFDVDGRLVSSNYIKPDKMLRIINEQGMSADRIENEGVQVMDDGSLITLNVINISQEKPGGLLLLRVNKKEDGNFVKGQKQTLDLSPAAIQKN